MDNVQSESNTSDNVKSELQPSDNGPSPSSNKQNSIFSLTIDEIQFRSGKSFGSINMDELLYSVWNVEENLDFLNSNENQISNKENVACQKNLPRQGSCSIPSPFCNRTVEEVWAEIQKNQSENLSKIVSDDLSERQPTFGEMTLEDFLVKVGVVQEGPTLASQKKIIRSSKDHLGKRPSNDTCLDTNIAAKSTGTGLEFSHANSEHNVLGNSSMKQVLIPSGTYVGELHNNIGNKSSYGMHNVEEQHVIRRMGNDCMELAIERRQRRMIKNRESAARSRARKQAYTAELEIELNQLREENARLKLMVEDAEHKLVHEVLKAKALTAKQQTTKKCKTIRRTTSLSW